MNRLILCGLLGISGFGISTAATLTPDEALARLEDSGMHRMPSAINRAPSMTYKSTIGNLYVFTSGKGYSILPNDDRVPALLAYSESDDFSLDGNPELEYWLDYYNSQIDYLQATGA